MMVGLRCGTRERDGEGDGTEGKGAAYSEGRMGGDVCNKQIVYQGCGRGKCDKKRIGSWGAKIERQICDGGARQK